MSDLDEEQFKCPVCVLLVSCLCFLTTGRVDAANGTPAQHVVVAHKHRIFLPVTPCTKQYRQLRG